MPRVGKPSMNSARPYSTTEKGATRLPIGRSNGQAETLNAVRQLHHKGLWVVFMPPGKKCRLKEWQKARRGIEEIETALTVDPHTHIGIVWNQSDYIDVDCDSAQAETTFLSWCNGSIPKTPVFQSKRGKHCIFKRPAGAPDKAKLVVDGVEFRGLSTVKGSCSVAPPSGGREWLPGLSLHDLEPAELPSPIIERLRSRGSPRTTETMQGAIYEGKRNDTLFKLANDLYRAKAEPDDVLLTLFAVNTLRCKPPLTNAEVESISDSASKQDHIRPQSHAQILTALALQNTSLWHSPDGTAYATIKNNGHEEHWKVRSATFRQWLSRQFYRSEEAVIGSQTLQDVLNALEGQALFDGETHPVHLRIAGDDNRIYIDLCNDAWQAVVVEAGGWRVIDNPPVRFRRAKGMLPLPVPEPGGSIKDLRTFVNATADGWVLLLAWILSVFRPGTSYPILKLNGEQGSAKTTLSKLVRSLTDPNEAPLRRPPKTTDDLMIAANNAWIVSYDNLSYLNTDFSDSLCSLSTGGSLTKRRLYSDDEETLLNARRPILLNGIEDMGTRSDLMDRCVNLELPRIEPDKRRAEVEFWAAFEVARPRILGALLDGVSTALRRLPEIRRTGKTWPRMADFAQFAEAGMSAFIRLPGVFRRAYAKSQATAHQTALESTPIIPALVSLLRDRGGRFEGTATDLLDHLKAYGDARVKGWPKAPHTLSGILTRLTPNLRESGFAVEQVRRHGEAKVWVIEKACTPCTP